MRLVGRRKGFFIDEKIVVECSFCSDFIARIHVIGDHRKLATRGRTADDGEVAVCSYIGIASRGSTPVKLPLSPENPAHGHEMRSKITAVIVISENNIATVRPHPHVSIGVHPAPHIHVRAGPQFEIGQIPCAGIESVILNQRCFQNSDGFI